VNGEARGPRRQLRRSAYWAVLCLVLASYLWRVSGLGLRFPAPWPDEGFFLWPAIAFQEANRLFAPQLNPERDLLWMPPGYMIVQGLVFKLTGFSLGWARCLSALYVCAAASALAALFAGLRARFVHLLLLGVFLHAPITLLAGNTARMEALLLATACAALLCIARGRLGPGLALLAAGPLVHPNGAFFAVGGAVCFLQRVAFARERRRAVLRQLLWLGLPLLLWAAYASYVARHWDDFVTDMTYQLNLKRLWDVASGGYGPRLVEWEVLVPALAALLGAAWAAWRRLPLFALLVFAASALVLTLMTRGWMYDVYLVLAQLLVAVACVEVARDVVARRAGGRARFAAWAGAATGLVLALGLGLAWTRGPLALTSVRIATVYPEPITGVPYVDESDRRALRAYLDSLRHTGRDLTVQFLPWSDSLLFRDLEGDGLRFQQPTFHEARSDVSILHESRWASEELRKTSLLLAIHREGITREALEEIHARDGTERWLVYRRDAPGAAAPAPK
jgi:hypothetical protein